LSKRIGPLTLQAPVLAGMALGALLGMTAMASAQEPITYEVVNFGIPTPLTLDPGDSERGWAIVQDASNATCLICHTMPMPWQPDHGNLAPDLAGVGSRYTAAELRLRLVDPKALNPDTIMPSYYRIEGLERVQEKYQGKTVYGPQDIEDVIAYLLMLTEE
jgi:sulfur-oxidizing protein SoxX